MTDEISPQDRLEKMLEVKNHLGLHLRAAKTLVEAIMPLSADVILACNEKEANARSILSLATLEAVEGTTVAVRVTGPQAAEALAIIEKLFEERFGEAE